MPPSTEVERNGKRAIVNIEYRMSYIRYRKTDNG